MRYVIVVVLLSDLSRLSLRNIMDCFCLTVWFRMDSGQRISDVATSVTAVVTSAMALSFVKTLIRELLSALDQ